mgnify:CR=1 FL=1
MRHTRSTQLLLLSSLLAATSLTAAYAQGASCAGVAEQLRRAGAAIHQWVPTCTAEDPGLYSYRRDGRGAGRFAGLIWIRP